MMMSAVVGVAIQREHFPHRRGLVLSALNRAIEQDGQRYLCIDLTTGCEQRHRLRSGGLLSSERTAERPCIVYADAE